MLNMKSIVTLILTSFIYIGCATYASHETDPEMDHHALHDLRITSRGPIPKGLINAGPSALKVVFRAFDNEFELDMKLNEHLYHAKAPKHIQRHWTYYGDVTMNQWLHGHATFTFERDDYHSNFHGSMIVDSTMYQISHADKLDEFVDTEHRMALSKHGEGKDWDKSTPIDLHENPHKHSERRRLNLEYFDNCWTDQDKYVKKLSTGYTIDNSFKTTVLAYMANEAGSDLDKLIRYVTQVNADTNMIYHNQLDVILSILDIKQPGESGSFTVSCPVNIDTYLDALTAWRGESSPTSGGMWKALTDCFPPPGTVGYAYVGTLCRRQATGVSNYMDIRSGGTWGVNAHEAGHIFGARHSFENGQGQTGGIMDYGDGLYNDVFQFNPLRFNEVCGVLQNTIPANNQAEDCWATIGKDDNTEYNWRKTTEFSKCYPTRGDFIYQTIVYECEVYVNGEKREGSMAECDVSDYPWGETKKCDAVAMNPTCGNGIIEEGEECEVEYNGECCVECAWSTEADCSGVDAHIDAAFMTDTNILYVVSRGPVEEDADGARAYAEGAYVYRYTGGQEEGLDSGYPKPIQEEWSGVTDEFKADGYIGGIVRKPTGNVMWIFQSRQGATGSARNIKYLEINYATGQLIEEKTLDQATLTDANYGNDIAFDNDALRDDPVSLSEDIFRKCGGVDAGLSAENFFYLFCGGIFVEFDWGMDVKALRPVKDLRLSFEWEVNGESREILSFVSAAFYNWDSNSSNRKSRVFNNGFYIDWWAFRPVGLQAAAYSLAFEPCTPGENGGDASCTGTGTSTECNAEATRCAVCRIGSPTTCYVCQDGFELFGTYCLERTNDIIINFGTEILDGDVQWLLGGVPYFNELIGTSNIVGGAGIDGTAAAHLQNNADGSTDRIDFAPIYKSFIKFELEAWFKPNIEANHAEFAQFFTFTDGSSRRISVALEAPNIDSYPHMVVQFLNAPQLRCVTDTQIVGGEWIQFILKVSAGSVDCCIQGSCIAAAYEGVSEEALNFVLQDWYLGDSSDGIIGHVDSITLKITEDLFPGVEKKTLVYVVVCILLFGILGVLGFKYRSDFLNPCGDQHDRTVSSRSNPTIQSGSWKAKSSEGSGTGGTGLPPSAPARTYGLPPPRPGKLPVQQPPLAKNTSFQKAPPRVPTKPKPSGLPKRGGSGLPAIKKQSTGPPKRAFPPRKPPGKKSTNPRGPPPPPLKNLW